MKILEYFIYLILKFLNILPQNIQNLIGKALGKIFYKKLDERREIARWNLKKCFPEKTDEEISTILKLSFIRLGESLFEFLNAFWASDKKLEKLIINFDEIKNITEDLDKSKGKLLLFMHTPNLDLVVRVASLFMPVSGEIIEFNDKLETNPEVVNEDPYGEGWMIKIKLSSADDLNDLLSPEEYQSEVA